MTNPTVPELFEKIRTEMSNILDMNGLLISDVQEAIFYCELIHGEYDKIETIKRLRHRDPHADFTKYEIGFLKRLKEEGWTIEVPQRDTQGARCGLKDAKELIECYKALEATSKL